MAGELELKAVKSLTLFTVQRSKEFFVDQLDDGAQPAQRPFPLGSEADEMAAPVARIALPLEQSALLELVQQPDQVAAVVAEHVGDHRLRLGRLLVEQREHCIVIRAQARGLE